jgi:LETM1-like protein
VIVHLDSWSSIVEADPKWEPHDTRVLLVPCRRERQQLARTTADMFRLVPMIIIVVSNDAWLGIVWIHITLVCCSDTAVSAPTLQGPVRHVPP